MIRELVEYATTHDLVVRPGYVPKTVKWVIEISSSGQYLGINRLGDATNPKSPGRSFPAAPHLEQPELIAGGRTRTQFLVETVAIVTNGPDETGKMVAKHAAFVETLESAATAVPELEKWHLCLDNPSELNRIREDLKAQKAKPNERITVRCGDAFLVARTDWHGWWDQYRQSIRPTAKKDTAGLCIITGETGPIASTHPKIAGLVSVGGSSMGSSLVSFDKESFRSYGLNQGANASMLETVAVSYQIALNTLIAQGMTLAGMRVAYWYRGPVNPEDDAMADFGFRRDDSAREDQDLQEAQRTLSSVNRRTAAGEVVTSQSVNRFYVLLLSGVAGRVMVRGWYEGAYEDLKHNVEQWFSDLSIVRPDNSAPRRLPLFTLLGHLMIPDRTVPPPQVRQLWESAILAREVPRAVAHGALRRVQHDVVKGNMPSEGSASLLKAYLIRKTKGTVSPMLSALNPDEPRVAYQLGRLLAVIDSLQAADSQGSRGTLSSRYFTAASTTPLVVIGRLMRMVPYYLARISSDGLKFWYNNHVIEITSRIPAGQIPQRFGFEEQATFALGYYHQLAAFRSGQKKEDKN